LEDQHDLIQKACGWMLREVGKRNPSSLEGFLSKYHATMPRTMLRYAIDRFTHARRANYLNGLI
jgi:3-methyladenine DNA glycosylase AlkD